MSRGCQGGKRRRASSANYTTAIVGVWVVAGRGLGFVAAHLVCFGVRGQAARLSPLLCLPANHLERLAPVCRTARQEQALVSLALHAQKQT